MYPQVSCTSCPICAQPDPIAGVDVIIQIIALNDTAVSVWLLTDIPISGGQADTICSSKLVRKNNQSCTPSHNSLQFDIGGDETKSVQLLGSFGGAVQQYGLEVAKGEDVDGRWLFFSFEGLSIPPVYFHLTTLLTESLSDLSCDAGSVGLVNAAVTDPEVIIYRKNDCVLFFLSFFLSLSHSLKVNRTFVA